MRERKTVLHEENFKADEDAIHTFAVVSIYI